MSRDGEAAATRDARDEALKAILERARQTRRPLPRFLWLAAVLVAMISATGLALVLLDDAPARSLPTAPESERGVIERPSSPSGASFGGGLAIGAAAGLAIGFALGRRGRAQRPDHSSRSKP